MFAAGAAVIARRGCAIGAAGSAAVHGLMLGSVGNPAVAVIVIVMMAACLYCAKDLWLEGSTRAWCLVAVMNLGMVAVHWSMPGHHHETAVTQVQVVPASTLMTVAVSLSLIEAAVATAVLYLRTRRRAGSLTPQWN
jgi:hypothetical protein